MTTKTDWFQVDGELWSKEDKLDWPTRKLAIYLRDVAGSENIVTKYPKTIMDATGLSLATLKKSLRKLSLWPSRRKRLVKSYNLDQGIIILRDVPRSPAFVRVYRWLWYSDLPDDVKDVLLFIRSCYESRKSTAAGRELFSLNRRGEKQRSIYRCCYLMGTHNVERTERISKVVKFLFRSGLVACKTVATTGKAMVVELADSEPIAIASEAYTELLGSGLGSVVVQRGVAGSKASGSVVASVGVAGSAFRGSDTTDSVFQTPNKSDHSFQTPYQQTPFPVSGNSETSEGKKTGQGEPTPSELAAEEARRAWRESVRQKRAVNSAGKQIGQGVGTPGLKSVTQLELSKEEALEKLKAAYSLKWAGDKQLEADRLAAEQAATKDAAFKERLAESQELSLSQIEVQNSLLSKAKPVDLSQPLKPSSDPWVHPFLTESAEPPAPSNLAPRLYSSRHRRIVATVEAQTPLIASTADEDSLRSRMTAFLRKYDQRPEDEITTTLRKTVNSTEWNGVKELSWGWLLTDDRFRQIFQEHHYEVSNCLHDASAFKAKKNRELHLALAVTDETPDAITEQLAAVNHLWGTNRPEYFPALCGLLRRTTNSQLLASLIRNFLDPVTTDEQRQEVLEVIEARLAGDRDDPLRSSLMQYLAAIRTKTFAAVA